jgi:hypothetical protein
VRGAGDERADGGGRKRCARAARPRHLVARWPSPSLRSRLACSAESTSSTRHSARVVDAGKHDRAAADRA